MPEDSCIDYILKSQPDDPRLKKWEYKIILDTLQELESTDIKTLLDTINTNHKKVHNCNKDLFSYSSLYGIVGTLTINDIIEVKDKKYSVSPEHVTSKLRYMPISTYCVAIFTLSVVFMIYSFYEKTNIQASILFVIAGALYIIAQMFGEEFSFNNFKPK